MSRIVWLASYPKSGNTWFRAFLANFLRNDEKPVSINELNTGGIASARLPIDQLLGYRSAYLPVTELMEIRREFYLRKAAAAKQDIFLKVHDARVKLPGNRSLFPSEATKCALYFIRNPLDVCVSYAHHTGHDDFARTARHMGWSDFSLSNHPGRSPDQLFQLLTSWSQHVRTWIQSSDIRVLAIRYEDMCESPTETFTSAVAFAGLPLEPSRIAKAIAFSRFDELQSQEAKAGFRERMHSDRPFFRKGRAGSWKETLPEPVVKKISEDHAEIMKQFGYSTA